MALTGMLWSLRPLCEEATWARYWMTFFVFSVLPAPDSPLKTTKETDGMEIHMGQTEGVSEERGEVRKNTLFSSHPTNIYNALSVQS